jgi:hypothetical protein
VIWVFLLTLIAGAALTFASLEYIPFPQSRRRKFFVIYGLVISAAFALGFAVDFQAMASPRPVHEASQHG